MKTGVDRFASKGRQTSIRVRQERARQRAAELAPIIIAELLAVGVTTLKAIADAFNDRAIPTSRGGRWSAVQIRRIVALTI